MKIKITTSLSVSFLIGIIMFLWANVLSYLIKYQIYTPIQEDDSFFLLQILLVVKLVAGSLVILPLTVNIKQQLCAFLSADLLFLVISITNPEVRSFPPAVAIAQVLVLVVCALVQKRNRLVNDKFNGENMPIHKKT